MSEDVILVAGGGGFIGGHLVGALREGTDAQIRSVDIKPLDRWYQRFDHVENLELDLREPEACGEALRGAQQVYNLAADMGGMGFIEHNKALCMLSVMINTRLLMESEAIARPPKRMILRADAGAGPAEAEPGRLVDADEADVGPVR